MKSVDRFRRYIRRILFLLAAAAVIMLAGSGVSIGAEADLEKGLQTLLEKSRLTASAAAQKLTLGKDISQEIGQLKTLADSVRVTNLLLEERFRLREEKVKTLGSSALSRQQAMAEGYKAALTEYLSLIDSLPADGSIPQSALRNLQSLLEKLLPKRKRPIIGSLPYKHLNLPAVEPSTAPAIMPAYKGGNKTVSPDDTAAAPEAPISKEIAALAQSLNWNPVSIYEYVKNNVEIEWYWGCMKGAEDTLHQKSGNDCDQAALLTALFRASGFPTRYVRGVIEFFPDIERARNLTGIDDPAKIAELFQKAGIPYKPVIQGGKISNFQIEHIWVETLVPYSNYRGSIIDEHGKAWLGLDTSIKVKGYEYGAAKDLIQEPGVSSQLSGIRDEYLGLATAATGSTPFELNQTPLEYMKARLTTADYQLSDFMMTRTLLPEDMKILPASLQFGQVKVTNEYTAIPDELKHKIKLSAVSSQQSASGSNLLEITLDVLKLSNQQITLSYEPETVQDQEIINSFGGLDNTPAYLVRLRPILKVNGERIVVATDGLPMGADYELTVELISPNGTEKITNTLIVGNLTVIGVTPQKAVLTPSPLAGEGGGEGAKDAERILYETANHYIDRWNNAEDELASLLHLTLARPIPTVVTLGGVIDVTYLLDMPHGFTWKGVYVDADLRRIETVTRMQSTDARQKLFMQMSSLQGSILENRIFEDDFKVESISTAKLIQIYQGSGSQLLTIDKTNIDSILPTLPFDENIKEDIVNSVNQQNTIRIPLSEITYHDWSGIGYVKENIETGESGWMLSGMIAGGSTVDAEWLNNLYLQQTLSTPYAGATNHDPLAGVRLFKIPATDKQDPKTVGTALSTPFAAAVLDGKNLPVVGATVSFRIIAGGGTIQCLNQTGAPTGPPSETDCEATTSNAGIAKATLTLGIRTDANADYMKLNSSDENYTQIGLNLVTASAQGHSGLVALNSPFEAYGKPDVPAKIVKVYPLNNVYVLVNNPAGTLHSRVTDTYSNPVSNVPITFTVQDPVSNDTQVDPLLPGYRNLSLYTRETCTNPYPVAGDCALITSLTLTTYYYGAQVDTILGNTLNTHYTVRVSASGLEAVTFDLHSQGTRGNANAYIPSVLMLWNLGIVNEKGEPVNAAKAGTELKAPLMAKMFLLQDEYDIQTAQEPCTKMENGIPVTFTGYNIVSNGTITIRPINNGTVSFTPKEGQGTPSTTHNLGNGQYMATYQTGISPAKNTIEADGNAVVTVPETWTKTRCLETSIINDKTVTLEHGQYALFDQTTHALIPNYATSMKPTYTAYGVNTTLTIQPSIVLMNDQGYTTADTTLTYTIQPGDYRALRVDLDAYKSDGQNTPETWEGYVVADATQGQGTVVFVAGTPFDVTKLHKEQVVLNRGSDMEVRGEKKDIPLLSIIVHDDSHKTAKEIKFGRGDREDKRYHVDIPSPIAGINCAYHTGMISVVDKDGQLISPPAVDEGAYSVSYPVTFQPFFNGTCIVNFIGTPNGAAKQKFIVSNRSQTDLPSSDIADKVVLYGGLGNKVRVEIDGLRQEIPIEPVGVVVLGIDGLRQDVLYPDTMDGQPFENVNEPAADYYVDASTLSGLGQILVGDPQISAKQKYIMLPKVTTIFPSITFAAWASIFTGKTPNETGILGNEFFARDIYNTQCGPPNYTCYNSLPGLWSLPAGMVTLDADGGAFRPSVDTYFFSLVNPAEHELLDFLKSLPFILNYVMPAEFEPFNHSLLSIKNSLSAPNAVLHKTTLPVWDEINTLVKDRYKNSSTIDTKCGDSQYECRTVSMFNQYFRNVDWFGTPAAISLPLYNGYITQGGNLGAAMMDSFAAEESVDFVKKYFSMNNTDGKRKRFPAVFSVYLSGLDHYAHVQGLGGYVNYFRTVTDEKIWKIAKALKDQDEFDNKIFIIVSDHGETQMPTDLKYKDTNWLGFQVDKEAEMSCALKTDFTDPKNPDHVTGAQKAEKANNSLHVWELATMFQQLDPTEGWRLLAPKEVEQTIIANLKPVDVAAVTSGINQANVIAALNGPMAHIYVKGAGGWNDTNSDVITLGRVADQLSMYFAENGAALSEIEKEPFPRLLTSIDKILIRVNGNYKVFKGLAVNESGEITGLANPGSLTELESNLSNVNAATRIEGMNHDKRSGDIILLMKDDTNDAAVTRFSTAYACKSWHGSLSKSDSYVPLIVSYPGGNKQEFSSMLTSVCSGNACEGNWKMTDLIKKIIEIQYIGQ